QHLRGDNYFLNFASAFVDPQWPYVAIEPLWKRAANDTPSAEKLYSRVDCMLCHFRRKQLRHAGFTRRPQSMPVFEPGGPVDEKRRCIDRQRGVGDPLLGDLKCG